MDVCFVPSLVHLSCTKVATLLLSKALQLTDLSSLNFTIINATPIWPGDMQEVNTSQISSKIVRNIKILKPFLCDSLQKKLENYIAPLCYEMAEWLKTCYCNLAVNDNTLFVVFNNMQYCWRTDGSVDEEKAIELLIKNIHIRPVNRFVLSCVYCFHEDILNLWQMLSEKEKYRLLIDSNYVVKNWITWLESWLNKDWPFCVAWILGTSVWTKNVCVLKRVLGALTPKERSHYLFQALTQSDISSNVMLFCLSLMTRDEQEIIFREFPLKVCKCFASWPMRCYSFNIANILWPYLTADTFCRILNMFLLQMKNQGRDCVELLEILKSFWIKSPPCFQNRAKNDLRFCKRLHYILEHNFTQAYSKQEYEAAKTRAMPVYEGNLLDLHLGHQGNLHPLLFGFPLLIPI